MSYTTKDAQLAGFLVYMGLKLNQKVKGEVKDSYIFREEVACRRIVNELAQVIKELKQTEIT